jgi:hypothetical protein
MEGNGSVARQRRERTGATVESAGVIYHVGVGCEELDAPIDSL